MTQTILQTLLGLGFVIGLFLIMAWVMRRVSQGPGLGGKHIQLVAGISLGTKEKLVLVEAGGQQLLLGVTSQQINTLHTFAEPIVRIEEKNKPSEFAQKLQSLLKRQSIQPTIDAETNGNSQSGNTDIVNKSSI